MLNLARAPSRIVFSTKAMTKYHKATLKLLRVIRNRSITYRGPHACFRGGSAKSAGTVTIARALQLSNRFSHLFHTLNLWATTAPRHRRAGTRHNMVASFAFALARPSPLMKTTVLEGHGDKEPAFKQIRHCTTWTNSLTKSSALRFHALLAATSSNTACRETLPCRTFATYHPIGSVGVLVDAWVPEKSCHASSARDST